MHKWMIAVAFVGLAACEPDLNVPNLNNPSQGNPPTRSTVIANAQQGIFHARTLTVNPVRTFGIWGREIYDLRPQEPRPYTDNLIGPRDPNSFGSATNFAAAYNAFTDNRVALAALEELAAMTDAEKEGIRGWLKTVDAYAYYQLGLIYEEHGAPINSPEDPNGELEEVVTSAQLFDRSIALYDEAATHLAAAGSSFAFGLPAGFGEYTTPTEFIKVNRALKARALKYMGRWSDVLTALQGSFIDASADMNEGVHFSYDPQSGGGNPFNAVPTDFVHPRILANAQLQPDGTLDQRALDKTRAITPTTIYEIAVTHAPNVAPDNTTSFPWIENEELLLMRAEANLATGNAAAALADVNIVRQQAGGLAPLASVASNAALLDEILYNRLYSMFFEGGFAYWDARQYDRLTALPRSNPAHRFFTTVHWPLNECNARGTPPGPCTSSEGM